MPDTHTASFPGINHHPWSSAVELIGIPTPPCDFARFSEKWKQPEGAVGVIGCLHHTNPISGNGFASPDGNP
jgi:hypothetical protein